MKVLIKYAADDGTEFSSPHEAEAHDGLLREIDEVLATLRPVPEGSHDFDEGKTWVQQDARTAKAAEMRLIQMAARGCDTICTLLPMLADIHGKVNSETIARLLSEHGMHSLARAWMRFERMDAEWREFAQPSFKYTLHPVFVTGTGTAN